MNFKLSNLWNHWPSTVGGFLTAAAAIFVHLAVYADANKDGNPIMLYLGLASIVIGALYGNETKDTPQ